MDQGPVCPSNRISDYLRQILQHIKMVSTPFFSLFSTLFYLTRTKAIWWVALPVPSHNGTIGSRPLQARHRYLPQL
jgi:hypothetical protein